MRLVLICCCSPTPKARGGDPSPVGFQLSIVNAETNSQPYLEWTQEKASDLSRFTELSRHTRERRCNLQNPRRYVCLAPFHVHPTRPHHNRPTRRSNAMLRWSNNARSDDSTPIHSMSRCSGRLKGHGHVLAIVCLHFTYPV